MQYYTLKCEVGVKCYAEPPFQTEFAQHLLDEIRKLCEKLCR